MRLQNKTVLWAVRSEFGEGLGGRLTSEDIFGRIEKKGYRLQWNAHWRTQKNRWVKGATVATKMKIIGQNRSVGNTTLKLSKLLLLSQQHIKLANHLTQNATAASIGP